MSGKLTYTKTGRRGKSRSITREKYKRKLNKAYDKNKVSSYTSYRDNMPYRNLSANLGRRTFTQSSPMSKTPHKNIPFKDNAINKIHSYK